MKMIIANFKSNKNKAEMEEWIKQLTASVPQQTAHVVLCPPFPHLYLFQEIGREKMSLGVQDISSYPAGSYTGAVSARNLDGLDIHYAIIGHSERRKYFHETTADIAKKIRECLANEITPIVCVTKDEINATANALEEAERKKCIVAFEPVEHIGTGESDTLAHILETRDWVHTAFGTVPYIYGGSVNPDTDPAILKASEIDGFLVGSASLNAQAFSTLLTRVA